MRKLEGVMELTEYLKSLPKVVAKTYLRHSQDSFKKGGFTNERFVKWPERVRPDRNDKQSRAVLVKTGRLVRSIRATTKGTTAIISSSVPYAKIHNEGGKVSGRVSVRRHQRRGRKSKRGKRTKIDVRAHTRKVNTRIPKRQFMGRSKVVNDRIVKNLIKEFKKYF